MTVAGGSRTQPAGADLAGLRLILDPGHGGCDGGSVPGEAGWTLAVAADLAMRCRRMGADVVPTRCGDAFVPRLLRGACARECGGAAVLSLHRGAPYLPSAGAVRFGAPWWCRRRTRALAARLLEALDRALPVRPLPWAGARYGGCTCPPVPWRCLALLLIVHPPGGPSGRDAVPPEFWSERLAQGLAAWYGPSPPGPARPEGTRTASTPSGVPAGDAVDWTRTMDLVPGRRQTFRLPTHGAAPAGPRR